MRRFEQRRRFGSLGFQLDLAIALGGGFSEGPAPSGIFKLGRRCVEASGDVINKCLPAARQFCQALFCARGRVSLLICFRVVDGRD